MAGAEYLSDVLVHLIGMVTVAAIIPVLGVFASLTGELNEVYATSI